MSSSTLTALICDHHLDPRLRKRASWLKESFEGCDIVLDPSRGQHFQSKSEKNCYETLSQAKLSKLKKYDLIYISGAKIIIIFFIKFLILKYIYNVELVYEIPDLPLRSHYVITNRINSLLFYVTVKLLFKKVVITSRAFLRKLPSNLDYFECENFPPLNLLDSTERKLLDSQNCKITISFVGVIRYLSQMELLIKFSSLHEYVKIRFYGGPYESVLELKALHQKYGEKGDVQFLGQFETCELSKIYTHTDFIYSVYDSKQENVRLALPNKLYESIVYNIPLIVSTNTFLYEKVLENKNGFGVDSQSYKNFESDIIKGIKKEYKFSDEKLKIKIMAQERLFLKWLNVNSEN